MKIFFLFASLLCTLSINAQSAPVFLGKVLDATTGEPLDAASVFIPQNHYVGTITNSEGEFVLDKCLDYDSLAVSHLGYHTKKVCLGELPRAIRMKRSVVNLSEVTILPIGVIMKRVWEKYNKIYQKGKKNKNRQLYTFFYRQTTQSDSVYNEFIESFFTGYNGYSITALKLEKGRYAKVANTGLEFTFSLINFFPISQARPFHQKMPPKNVYNTFLQPNSKDIYDITLDEIINSGEFGDVYVVKFTPKEKVKDKLVISGKLFVRQEDLSIVKFEGEINDMRLRNVKAKDTRVLVNVNYLERENDFPIVESVKCNAQFGIIDKNIEHKVHINSTMFVVDNLAKSTGKKMKDNHSLINEISKTKYDPAFWQNNPIVKRTNVEEEIIKSFENKNVFGNLLIE